MKAYQEHERRCEGKDVTHGTIKKLLAGLAVSFYLDALTSGGGSSTAILRRNISKTSICKKAL